MLGVLVFLVVVFFVLVVILTLTERRQSRFFLLEKGIPTGASAILFPQPWNTFSKLNGDKLEFVAQALEKLSGEDVPIQVA